MAVNGALATTVADLALAHAVMAGEEPAEPPAPGRPLRIAVSTRSPMPGVRADADARAAVDAVVALLAAAGHTVVRRDPPITTGAAAGALARWMVGAEDDAEHLGIDRRPCSRAAGRTPGSGGWSAGPGWSGPRTAERFRERMVAFFDDVDLLLSPVTTGPPLAARPWHERSFLANVTANARWAPWTAAWNLAGLPAARPARRACAPRGCPWPSSSSAPRAPRRVYSGSPENWNVGSPGAATHRSSIPPQTRPPHPYDSPSGRHPE